MYSKELFRDYRCFPNGYFFHEALSKEQMKHAIPIVIVILAFVGLADSVYLTLAHYRIVDPVTLETSGVCNLATRACESVILSPQATIAGIPHAVLGAGYFALLLTAGLIRVFTGRWFAPWPTFAVLLVGLGWSAFLTQELLLRLHAPCPFCLTAHGINAVVLALYAVSLQ